MKRVDDLLSVINKRNGVVRPNRYTARFTPPAEVRVQDALYNRDLNILCESVIFPGRNVATSDYMVGRQNLKNPYTFINSDVTATFLLTGDYLARRVFMAWQAYVFNPFTYEAGYKNEYARTDMYFLSLDLNDKELYRVTLHNAYPTSISEMTLSNTEENSVMRMNVTFAYDNFEESGLTKATDFFADKRSRSKNFYGD